MKLTVECYSGRKADERPARFWLDGRLYKVDAVLGEWYEPESIAFKVRTDDGSLFVLRKQTSTPEGMWNLVSFRRTGQER